MRAFDEAVDLAWSTPAEALGDLPALVLSAVVLTFAHSAGRRARDAVVAAFAACLGPAQRRGLFATRLAWTGKTPVEATVGKGHASLRFGQKVKPARLADVLEAVAQVPGACDIRVRAKVRRFSATGPESAMLDG